MFSVKPRCGFESDEELTSVGVGAGVRHAHDSCSGVFEVLCDFVFEFASVKAFTAGLFNAKLRLYILIELNLDFL
jgi:hypothetical protein